MGAVDYLLYNLGLQDNTTWGIYHNKYNTSIRNVNGDPLNDVNPIVRTILKKIPIIILPTIFIFFITCTLMCASIYLHFYEYINDIQVTILLTIFMYIMFTIAHEAAHGSISNNQFINNWVGRVSFATLGPTACFAGWKTLHLMHHKYTNHPEKDLDRYSSNTNNRLLLPVRWFTNARYYVFFWLSLVDSDPAVTIYDKLEVVFQLTIHFTIFLLSFDFGYFYYFWTYWCLPSFLANGILIFAFDYLPHHKHFLTPNVNRYKTTSMLTVNAILHRLTTVLFLYQNYHLLHPLYPTIPFYRYINQWNVKKSIILPHDNSFQPLF